MEKISNLVMAGLVSLGLAAVACSSGGSANPDASTGNAGAGGHAGTTGAGGHAGGTGGSTGGSGGSATVCSGTAPTSPVIANYTSGGSTDGGTDGGGDGGAVMPMGAPFTYVATGLTAPSVSTTGGALHAMI